MKIKILKLLIVTAVVMILLSGEKLLTQEYELTAEIETKRKGNLITILFKGIPDKTRYLIIDNKKVLGEIDLLRVYRSETAGGRYRGIATYRLFREKHDMLIRSGSKLGLLKKTKKYVRDFSDPPFIERLKYSRRIISHIDEREMVLVASGKFFFGSDTGDRDEAPEHKVYLDNYYIDRYEVSNRDFKVFVDKTHNNPPASWVNGIFRKDTGDLPVLVTYHEALAYATWCGKRLPDEYEWEKAARGSGGAESDIKGKKSLKFTYPWGRKFNPDRVNSLEFWSNKKTGRGIKEKYSVNGENYLSIYSFEKRGESPYSVLNMSGNAMEWTSSWYKPYKGSSYDNKRYGTQYKVIRGGAWFSNKHKVRVTNREIGGIPNLYTDSIAGFRCVKEPTSLDRID